jgi:Acyclic terpene utilisation family protein AtuA
MKTIRIGAGAGFSGDRIEPAIELAERGELDYLAFECLAERTIALAQLQKLTDPASGYDLLLAERMRRVLPIAIKNGVKIITNMGAANPMAAGQRVAAIANELGLSGVKIAVVLGDDVTESLRGSNLALMETGEPIAKLGSRLVSANAYLGVSGIVEALANGANVVITGRAADPALFLAPLVHEFGWAMDDWERLGRGTLAGHLLECAGQITGGYFADPGKKDIAGLARLGFPIGEIDESGAVTITKLSDTGGAVTLATCKEQLLYEVHDPVRYLQPDVVADFSGVAMRATGPDRVALSGARGSERTGKLKVSVGYRDGFIGEGQISYAGPGAAARGQLALDIARERMAIIGVTASKWRYDLIGVNALYGERGDVVNSEPNEVRVRVVGRTASRSEAERIGNEVETLYCNGPAGGGGVSKSARENIGVGSVLIDESVAKTTVSYFGERAS